MSRATTLPALTLIVLAGLMAGACPSTKPCNAGTVMVTVGFDAATSAADALDVYASVDASASTMTTLAHGAGASEGSIELYFPNFGGYPTGRRLDVTVVARLGAATLGTSTGSIPMLPDGCGTMTIALAGNGGVGTGGTTGGAGTTGAAGRGGTTGGAGTTGTGGVGGCAACVTGQSCVSNVCMNLNCTAGATVPPVSPLITDFSDAVPDPSAPGQFRYGGGMLNRVQGGTALFQNPASTKGTLTLSNNALTFTGSTSAPISTVGPDQYPYNGFSVYVDGPACVDASAYSRVSFILTGNLGTCNLQFSFAYSEILSGGVDPERGTCTAASCFSSLYVITTSVTSVAFNATPMIAGSPVAATDKAKLTGVQFELVPTGTTGCIGSVTVTNIRFQ